MLYVVPNVESANLTGPELSRLWQTTERKCIKAIYRY